MDPGIKIETSGLKDGICQPDLVDLNAFRRVLNMMTGAWKLDIVWRLLEGPMRFSDLQTGLAGITRHTLSRQLKRLEIDGLVVRQSDEGRSSARYALSPSALQLKPQFWALTEWSRTHGETRIDR